MKILFFKMKITVVPYSGIEGVIVGVIKPFKGLKSLYPVPRNRGGVTRIYKPPVKKSLFFA